MAYESVAITPGSGKNIAVDTVSSQEFQVVKIDVGADGATTGPVSSANPMPTSRVATATGGWSTTHINLAASANATVIKASAGTVGGIDITNNSATMFYVQFHNFATTPVLNSTAVVRKVGCQAGVPRYLSFGELGLNFSTGIGITVTTGLADTSITTVAASAGIVDIHWI